MNTHFTRKRLSIGQYIEGILQRNPIILGKAISLIESSHSKDRVSANELLQSIMPYTGRSIRLGITGVPGAGKSTFIETFGAYVADKGHRVAVLSIDPSSSVTKGSILGDKTRMEKLSSHQNVFIRPTAAGDASGGVHHCTGEVMLLCEAAGYDIVIVETVGVGQNEIAVRELADLFLLLIAPGTGDELQGIKKGIVEMADLIIINKNDGDHMMAANVAKADYASAIHLMKRSSDTANCKVLLCSSLEGTGISEIYSHINHEMTKYEIDGMLEQKRSLGERQRMHGMLQREIMNWIYGQAWAADRITAAEESIVNRKMPASLAVHELMRDLTARMNGSKL